MLIRRCVYENINKDEIHKLFPAEVLPEMKRLLTLLLQKFHSEWREDIQKEWGTLPKFKTMTWDMASHCIDINISPCQGLFRGCEFTPNEIELFVDREDKSPPKFVEFASLAFLMFPREDEVSGQSVRKIVLSCYFDMKD